MCQHEVIKFKFQHRQKRKLNRKLILLNIFFLGCSKNMKPFLRETNNAIAKRYDQPNKAEVGLTNEGVH